MILATVTYDVDLCPLCISGGQGNTSWGFYLVCPAGQEISDSKEISRDLFHVRKRRRANIRHCALVYRDHRDVHWTTRQTHSDVYIYGYTRTHVMCTQACIRTYRRISKPNSDVQHLWDFLVFDQRHSSTLCACS